MPRHAKPVSLHRLQGTFERGRHAEREKHDIAPVGELSPVPPDWLSSRGKRIWIATLPFLPKGVVGTGDTEILAGFCEQAAVHQRAIEAQAKLDEGKEMPFLTRNREGQAVQSPYLRIARQSLMTMVQTSAQLGLSPAARARIGAMRFAPDQTEDDERPVDPWTRFSVYPGGKGR